MHDPTLALTRTEFWGRLDDAERAFFRDLERKLGPTTLLAAWRDP